MNVVKERPGVVAAVVAAVVALVVVLAILVFGGSEDEARRLLDRAFGEPIGSADVALDASVQVNGVRQLEQPIRLQVRGPYQSGQNRRIPSADFQINFSAQGQSFAAGLISNGQNAWVEFLGQAYEVGEQTIAQANQQIASTAGQQRRRSLRDLGVDPNRWLESPDIEGEEQIAGVPTDHVQAEVNIARLLEDLNTLGQRAGGQVGAPTRQLSAEQRERIERIVQDPEFDVYVGKDGKVRRLSTVLDLKVPEEDRQEAGGAESGKISFSIEFANVGSPKRITPPPRARPIQDLTEQIARLFGGGAGAGAPGAGAPGAGGGIPAPGGQP